MQQISLLPPLEATVTEHVYYATDFCNIKIGRSASPRRRGGELRAEMLYVIPGSAFEEKRHHRMWARYRIGNSEWFRPADELLLWLIVQLTSDGRTRQLHLMRTVILNQKQAA
jgi:hypothetical protein